VDSFEVFVGAPAETTMTSVQGTGDHFEASTGSFKLVYDPLRRWFNEVLWKGRRMWVWSTTASTPSWTGASAVISAAQKGYLIRNGKLRVVFRVHTNRGFDDEGTAYTSNGLGAAQLDDVKWGASSDPAQATTLIGSFEDGSGALTIDNTDADAWHSTGKMPKSFFHTHNLEGAGGLLGDGKYQDLCGPPGDPFRICDMYGVVISSGDHDNFEAAGGDLGMVNIGPNGNGNWGINSPTINLTGNTKTTPNSMGIDSEEAVATEDYYIGYEIYAGIYNIFTTGNGWQFGFASWPAKQRNGFEGWGEIRLPGFLYFNPDIQCYKNLDGAYANGLIVTSGPNSPYPDSLRLHLHKIQQCYRFGITAGCSAQDGAYFDNVSLVMIDGKPQPMSVDIWQWINDTFPVNESAGLPGTANFDTTSAIIRTGLNTSQTTVTMTRYDVPGDSIAIVAAGDCIRIDLVFRILPGPGNYVTLGDNTSGLRKVPTGAAAVVGGDLTFWDVYKTNPGEKSSGATPGAVAAAAQHAAAPSGWSSLAWNSARCDTADFNLFPVAARGFNNNIDPGTWQSMYHEDDPNGGWNPGTHTPFIARGGVGQLPTSHNRCFVIDEVTGPATEPNITCGLGTYPPAWVLGAGTGYDGFTDTYEGISVFPDGQFTPGTHVEYYLRREDLNCSPDFSTDVTLVPDTTVVTPQPLESSLDAHRWQEFSVLPDRWKDAAYTPGHAKACMLYVDFNDRRGAEAVWVGVADSIGATSLADAGNHNGWARATGLGTDPDGAAFRTYKNKQAGTTWDMYGVKASESLTTSAGQIGSREQYTDPAASNKVHGKYAKMGPTSAMATAYYRLIMIESGDLNSGILGPFNDRSQNDIVWLTLRWLANSSLGTPLGLWCGGDGFAESEEGHGDGAGAFAPFNYNNSLMDNYMGTYLLATNYRGFAPNLKQVADLVYNSTTDGVGDIYGVRNQCTYTQDVLDLTALPETQSAADYEDTGGGPFVASSYKPSNATRPWVTVLDGFNIFNVRSRYGVGSYGRLAYYYNSFASWFGAVCTVRGTALVTLDTPGTGNGEQFVNFMNLRNNPLRSGVATIRFGLAKSDRVEIKVYDVTGRMVRTLANRVFTPGEHSVSWDGVNDHGQMMARGVYFTQVKYQNSRFVEAKKLTILK